MVLNHYKKEMKFSLPRPSQIYQNWDFWFENIPSGNPGRYYKVGRPRCQGKDWFTCTIYFQGCPRSGPPELHRHPSSGLPSPDPAPFSSRLEQKILIQIQILMQKILIQRPVHYTKLWGSAFGWFLRQVSIDHSGSLWISLRCQLHKAKFFWA
jgi:hypothetical protein